MRDATAVAGTATGTRTILDRVHGPDDLRTLDDVELERLADELRTVIIESVGRHGGHLGSNLGAVELTLALHAVYRSPHDILLWDTGHQTYAHKLLTGRRAGFEHLRQGGGLSGYPSQAESEHDWVENSHASTILGYAHGLATAQAAATGDRRRVVAIIGDGSCTGGMAFEGFNNLGHTDTDCLVILNDNGRSYAPTASHLGAGLQAAGGHPGFFEALGLTYLGAVDGHDLPALREAIEQAARATGPRVLHVLTEKGQGYEPALNDPVKRMHDTSIAKPGSYTVAFGRDLIRLAEADDRVVAITAAMPDSTGLCGFAERFPDRFFDVGIAEQHAVTAAAGMAMGGLVPVVAIYSTFATRAIDQAMYDVGLHRLPVIFCLDRAGITGDDGPSHHGVLDLVLLSKVPGITIFTPSCLDDLSAMLDEAVAIATGPEPGPVAIRWSKTMPQLADLAPLAGSAGARRIRAGEDLCIIAVGKSVEAATEATRLLENGGVSVTLWDARRARPLDADMLLDAAAHRHVITVEDGMREGGIGATVADQVAELTLGTSSPPRVRVLGTPVAYVPHGSPDVLLDRLGPAGIAAAAHDLIRQTTHHTAGALS